jgi:hypothetical protein
MNESYFSIELHIGENFVTTKLNNDDDEECYRLQK